MDHQTLALLMPSLSERECEILLLLADGRSDAEISQTLCLQISTIKWYNRQIFNKLNVANRREAAQWMRQASAEANQRSSIPDNLPAPPTPFVGRAAEVATISNLLRKTRLVTILAPGGMGKTRLALAVADNIKSTFPNGVYYVPLTATSPNESIVGTIALALNLSIQRDVDLELQLLAYLHGKAMLLLLDNFEHLLDQSMLVSKMLQASPNLRILITSRERLHLHGEAIFSLGGLSFPQTIDAADTDSYDALDFLVQIAQFNIPDFQLDSRTRIEAIQLCQMTGGMPLALELAAAWLESLSLAEIIATISHNRTLMVSTLRDLPERHSSITAILMASWQRLSAKQRHVFMRLTVFRGGCSRTAARAVTQTQPETLQALVDHGLLRLNGAGRYSLHELLRQYGEEQLAANGLTDEARTEHSHYYLHWLSKSEGDLKGKRQSSALDEIDSDFENIRAAWLWAVEQHDLVSLNAALESLYWFCEFRNRVQQRAELLHAAMQVCKDEHPANELYSRLLARSWASKGITALPTRLSTAARHMLRRAYASAHAQHNHHELAVCCYQRALIAAAANNDRAASTLFQVAHSRFTEQHDQFYVAQTLLWWAFTQVDLMHFAEAELHARAAVHLLQEIGEEVGLARAFLTLGAAVENKPDYPEAERCYEEAYHLLSRMGTQVDAANVGGWYLAGAALRNGDFGRHRELAEELLAVAEHQNIAALKARAYGSLSLAAFIDEDYEAARRLAEQSIAHFVDHSSGIIAPVFLAYALFMLEEVEQSYTLLQQSIVSMANTRFLVFDFMILPLVAVLLAYKSFPEHAAVAVGLSLHHPASMYAWSNLIFTRTHVTARLLAQLGVEVYEKLVLQAQSLNAVDVFSWFVEIGQMTPLPPLTPSGINLTSISPPVQTKWLDRTE